MKFKEVFSLFLDAIYPPRCLFCGTVISPGEKLCELCEQENPMIHQKQMDFTSKSIIMKKYSVK